MKSKKSAQGEEQGELYQTRLCTPLDQRHPLMIIYNTFALSVREFSRVH
jgi:hypothetical protein